MSEVIEKRKMLFFLSQEDFDELMGLLNSYKIVVKDRYDRTKEAELMGFFEKIANIEVKLLKMALQNNQSKNEVSIDKQNP